MVYASAALIGGTMSVLIAKPSLVSLPDIQSAALGCLWRRSLAPALWSPCRHRPVS